MQTRTNAIAIIPARGGSKRIPGKNIKEFHGKPIIAYSIEAALESGCFDIVVVSTDSKEIAEISAFYGAEVSGLRPSELADDHTGVMDVVRHELRHGRGRDHEYQYACLIYATAPMMSPDDIRSGFGILKNSNTPFALSVTEYPFPIQRALRLGADKCGTRIMAQNASIIEMRSQVLTPMFHDAAHFCWGRVDAFLSKTSLYSGDALVIKVPRYRVCDIDTPEDWMMAELMYEGMKNHGI